MLSFLADENFNNDIVRGVRRRNPEIVILRAQDVGLSGAGDPEILEWSAANAVAVLTHDVATMTKYAHERTAAGKGLPEFLRSAAPSRSALQSSTLSSLQRAAWKASGRAGSFICR
jgi:hypothetical protein